MSKVHLDEKQIKNQGYRTNDKHKELDLFVLTRIYIGEGPVSNTLKLGHSFYGEGELQGRGRIVR